MKSLFDSLFRTNANNSYHLSGKLRSKCNKLNDKIASLLSAFNDCVSTEFNVQRYVINMCLSWVHCHEKWLIKSHRRLPVIFHLRVSLNVTMKKWIIAVICFILIPSNAVYYFRGTALIKHAVQSDCRGFINLTLHGIITYSFFSLAANSDLKRICQIIKVYSSRSLWQPELET